MKVESLLLTTGEKQEFKNLEECCKHFSISPDLLQINTRHKPFDNGILQIYRYAWYEITVYESIENCLTKPIKAIFCDKYGYLHD